MSPYGRNFRGTGGRSDQRLSLIEQRSFNIYKVRLSG